MASKVGIANMALSHLGVDKPIGNLTTEQSSEAHTIRTFYDIARDKALKEGPWPFSTRFAVLALVEEEPTTEWGFSYRYPSDCLSIHRILSGIRNDSRQSRAPYKIGADDSGQLVYTDSEDAEIEYTARNDDPSTYTDEFELAFSYLLASLAAPRLTSGDQFKLGERARRLYEFEIAVAGTNSANEEQPDEEVEAESIRART